MGLVSRASLILQGDTKAAETAHNKAAEAAGRARFHGGDLPGLSHAADKETGIRLREESRLFFFFFLSAGRQL